MRHLCLALAGAALLAGPAAAAESTNIGCKDRIQQVASRIPAKKDRPQAADRMNISEQHILGALAALDAARIARGVDETEQCRTLVSAAEGLLSAGGWSPRTQE